MIRLSHSTDSKLSKIPFYNSQGKYSDGDLQTQKNNFKCPEVLSYFYGLITCLLNSPSPKSLRLVLSVKLQFIWGVESKKKLLKNCLDNFM